MVRSLVRSKRFRTVRGIGTGGQIVGTLLIGIAYLWPDELVRPPNATFTHDDQARVSLQSFIETLTVVPVWPTLFGGSALLMLTGMLVNQRMWVAVGHLVSASTWAAYATAGAFSAWLNPGTYLTGTVMAAMLLTVNVVGLLSWAEPTPASHHTSQGPGGSDRGRGG